jgi:glycosyltransferase involved in cell wall biosynthesis
VNSHWVANTVRKFYGIEPIVCPPGVDTAKFKPVRRKHDPTIDSHSVHKPFILSTNRHYPQKGLSDLIRIYSEVRRSMDCRLVVTGDFTPYTPNLRKLSSQLGLEKDILFTGHVTENQLIELNQNADVYAFTSPEEDFGLGPIEAMASGTPPVVWANAGPGETVVDGIAGLKAKPSDINDFSRKLTAILENDVLRRKLSRNAVAYVRKKYSWESHVNGLLKAFAEVT